MLATPTAGFTSHERCQSDANMSPIDPENNVVSLEDARRMEAEAKSQWNDLENKRSAQMHRAQGSNQTALQIKQQLVLAKQEVKDAKERRKVSEKRLDTAKREAKDAKKLQK